MRVLKWVHGHRPNGLGVCLPKSLIRVLVSWSRFSLGRFREGRPQRYLSVGAQIGASAIAVSRGPRVLVCRPFGNSPGRARSAVSDGTRSLAGPWQWRDPDGRGYWCIGRSVYWSGESRVYNAPVRTGRSVIRCA